MNRLSRAAAALVAAGLVVPVWAVPAHADTASETASSAAYFNRAGVSQPPGVPQAPPNLITEVDGVAPGNLAVGAQGGQPDKVSFLYFGLSELPAGATISKAVLKVPLVPADNANVSYGVDPALVSACKIKGSGFSSEDGTDLGLAPERDCPGFAVAATKEGESFVFDITGLATSWAEVNDGLALTHPPGGNGTFQVVFSREAVLDVEFTAPASTDTTTPVADTGAVTVDAGLGGSASSGSLGGFSGGTSDLGSGSASLGGGFGSGSVAAPLTGAPLPDAGVPAPATADAEPVLAAPVSSNRAGVDSSPTAGFWIAALLLAGALAFLSLVLGDPRTTVTVAAGPTRLDQALTARRRGTGGASLARAS